MSPPRSLVLAACFLGGCASRSGMLVAPTGETRQTGRDTESGVTMVITSGAWTGDPEGLEQDLEVLHVLVANEGDQPILLAPGDFEFRDRRGFRYAVLDVGASFRPATNGEHNSGRYNFDLERGYDPGGPGSVERILPQGDIGRLALPWGVLLPGSQIRGYLYLEPVSESANGGTLTWRMTTPAHQRLADVVFEMSVARSR
ncbi:MAG: hypothetical protein KUG77_24390 [Nannocystaceae bacterium]|nr:hypothetical protein [Nannocystaceae bacterium]